MFKLFAEFKKDVRRRGLYLDRDQAIQMDDIFRRVLNSRFAVTKEDLNLIDRFRRRVKEMQ